MNDDSSNDRTQTMSSHTQRRSIQHHLNGSDSDSSYSNSESESEYEVPQTGDDHEVENAMDVPQAGDSGEGGEGDGGSGNGIETISTTTAQKEVSPNPANNSNTQPNPPVRNKRPYSFINRRANPRQTTRMRKRWKQELNEMMEQLHMTECCKKLKCFANVNTTFLEAKIKISRGLSFENRRLALTEMMGSNGKFYFDGKVVCNNFLRKAFCFSGDIISSIRHGTKRVRQHDSMASDFHSQTTSNSDRGPAQRDAIITSLERLAESCGDLMPDVNETHLPFFRKRDVFSYFKEEFKTLYPLSEKCPSKSYFYSTWKRNCRSIKVRKLGRFAKCSTCERLRRAISDAVAKRDHKNLPILRRQKADHNHLIAKERREYKKKRDKARLQPNNYLSIIVDGADQSAFGLPHFMIKTKDDRGHSLKVRLIGLLEHNQENKLRLFTLTEEYPTGANHVIEAVHRFLTERGNQSTMPRVFYIQVDNCTKENKNRYLFSYLECLIRWNLFDEIQVDFLPVGHTHEDIDQTFSRTSDRLRCNDAITLDDLYSELRQVYNKHTSVGSMNNVVNWSGLCENTSCLTGIKNFSKCRYFKFYKMDGSDSISCMVRTNVVDEWYDLKNLSPRGTINSFTKHAPNLRLTPPLQIKCPEGKDKITECITAAEGRIPCVQKVESLFSLRDKVFTDRVEPFHWDVDSCIELNQSALVRDGDGVSDHEDEIQPVSPVERSVNSEYRYELNSFVAVKTDRDNGDCTFWIGKINSIIKDSDDVVSKLTLHWFDKGASQDLYTAKYFPSYNNIKSKKPGKKTPMKDDVSVDSVIVHFKALTKKHQLPASVSQHLRSI